MPSCVAAVDHYFFGRACESVIISAYPIVWLGVEDLCVCARLRVCVCLYVRVRASKSHLRLARRVAQGFKMVEHAVNDILVKHCGEVGASIVLRFLGISPERCWPLHIQFITAFNFQRLPPGYSSEDEEMEEEAEDEESDVEVDGVDFDPTYYG